MRAEERLEDRVALARTQDLGVAGEDRPDPTFMTVVVTRSRAFGGRGELPAHDVPIYGLLASLFEHGQSTGEVRRDVPAIELAEIFSGVFMFAVVSWLATGQVSQQHIEDAEAQLDGRLRRAFDVFLDGCRSPAG